MSPQRAELSLWLGTTEQVWYTLWWIIMISSTGFRINMERQLWGCFQKVWVPYNNFLRCSQTWNWYPPPIPQFSLETTTKKASLEECQLLQGAVLHARNLAEKNHMKGRKEIRYSQTVMWASQRLLGWTTFVSWVLFCFLFLFLK